MRNLWLSLPILFLSTGAFAQDITNALAMSCAAATELVRQKGAVVFGTGPGTYARYVRDGSYCQEDQGTDPAWIPTADQPQCLVGAQCVAQKAQGK